MKLIKIWRILLIVPLISSIHYLSEASCVFSNHIKIQEIEVGNLLSWETTQEIDNEHFIVQKSIDGKTFNTLVALRGAINSRDKNKYQYLDTEVGNKKSYYRLLMMDVNGDFAFTPEVVYNRNQENNLVIEEMSNFEVDRYFLITFNAALDGEMEYHVKDKSGRFVLEGKSEVKKGQNAISIDFDSINRGKYQVVLRMKKEEEIAFVYRKLGSTNPLPGVATKNIDLKGQ